MRKFSKAVLMCGLITIFSFPHVAGAVTLNYKGGDSEFVLSGNTDIKRQGQIVTLSVSDPVNEIIFVKQTLTDENGAYKFTFDLSQNGDAVASVSESGNLKSPVSLYKSTAGEIAAAISLINGESSIADIVDKAVAGETTEATAIKVLQINTTEFCSLNSSGVLAKALDGEQYTGIADFSAGYNVAKFLVECKNTTSAAELSELMAGYAERYDEALDEQYASYLVHKNKNSATIFDAYTTQEREAVLDKMYGASFESFEEFWNELYDIVLTDELNGLYNYSEKFELAEANNDFLELDFDKYEKLDSYYDDFQKEVFSVNYTDTAQLKELCETAYPIYLDKKNSKESNKPDNSRGLGGFGGTESVKVDTNLIPNNAIPEAQIVFTDIANHQWAQPSILGLAQRGIVSGKATGIFAPDDHITRGEFVKILTGALGIKAQSEKNAFSDVPSSHWAHSYVSAAVETGVVYGLNETLFGVDNTITREEMAAMCYRVMQYKQMNINEQNKKSFADDQSISDFAKEAVAYLGGAGIINGKGDNRFCPKDSLTRAEAAKMVYSLMLTAN